jgi:hypothetical protein
MKRFPIAVVRPYAFSRHVYFESHLIVLSLRKQVGGLHLFRGRNESASGAASGPLAVGWMPLP